MLLIGIFYSCTACTKPKSLKFLEKKILYFCIKYEMVELLFNWSNFHLTEIHHYHTSWKLRILQAVGWR